MDTSASIIPGQSAAGIALGSSITSVVADYETSFSMEEVKGVLAIPTSPLVRYRSEMVDLWAANGQIIQIMVHGKYVGKLQQTIGLGSTLAEVETQIGPVEEDEEDNLVISSLPGVCFGVPGSFRDSRDPALRQVPIREIFVFKS